ncbi:SDR family NAD(P)-dependent oxidoreductase [Cohnella sp. REN36]|uniref:SDR family NAD(P)-dependent oxidoreductase n=1 Tax=Cohnella sp. REN36 TaxID=2887347 RepID=UPI001D15E24F|nr:SDR family NAD(P)-dependent oxidoreductase [Cohnella sp. REN36]MCC3372469.1 SDR family oxidoreductase [Cohnella sp. REN36]
MTALPLRNRVAIVTGATRGIGRAVGERFASAGATVVGVYARSGEIAARLQAEMAERSQPGGYYQGAVDDPLFVGDLMKRVMAAYGRIDILVNNAGVTRDQLALRMSVEEWDDVLRTNLQGTLLCAAEAIPYMKLQGGGSVINVVSVSGLYGREAQANYSAAKGAVVGLTKLLARLHAEEGIRVNAVAPGMIATEMTERIPAGKMDNFLHHTHLKRQGTAQEIAEGILGLASGASGYLSGQVLKLDGGFLR